MSMEIIIAIAGVLLLASYLFTNILLQRILTLIAMLILIWAGFTIGYEKKEMKVLIYFCSLAALINLFHILHSVKESISGFLPKDLRQIRRYFPSMTNTEFLQLCKISQRRKSQKEDVLIIQDTEQINVFLITKGEVEVLKNETLLATVKPGNFIGEISYLTGDYTTASVIVSSQELEALEWNKRKLDKLRLKNPEVYNKFYQTLAINLVDKVFTHKAATEEIGS